MRHISARLIRTLPVAQARVESALDPLFFRVAHAQAIEHNGNWRAAADILERLRSDLPDASSRSFVETRLVRLFVGAERFSLAEHHLHRARTFVTEMGAGRSWHHAEVDVAAARLADATGDLGEANQLARRACSELQSWTHTTAEGRILNALIDGLTLRAEGAFAEGNVAAAGSFAFAACNAIGDARSLDPECVILAPLQAAAMVKDWPERDGEIAACYVLAAQAGLTRQAIVLAAQRAGFLRLAGNPRAAMEVLTPLVATAQVVGTGEPVALFAYELASCNLESGALESAGAYLTEVQERAAGSSSRLGYAEFVAAKVHLARRNYVMALRSAEEAESALAFSRRDRFLGPTLRLQAEALEGLGRKARALETIERSIEVTGAKGQTADLSMAYYVLSRISGDAKYAVRARQLRTRAKRPGDHDVSMPRRRT